MVQLPPGGAAGGAAPPPNYGLPPLPPLPCPEYRGPTPWSNWVIKGRLLAGAYPASLDDAETDRILSTLLELGVNTFVCLQAEFSLHTPEAAWRAGQGLRPYIKDAQALLIRARQTNSHRIKQDKLDFLHLPIIDGSVTSDAALSRLADDCCQRLLCGERMYIHCWGGHGRTGTLVAVMLGRLYGATCAAALRFTQAFHDSRKFPQGVRSPQTTPQVAQVKRLLPDPPSARGVAYAWDPSILLDDAIVRPSSAPPSPTKKPAAPAAVAPPPPPPPADMEVDGEPLALPAVPVNQSRKEAIRAKQAGGAGAGAGVSTGSAQGAAAAEPAVDAVAAALQAAGLEPRGVPAAPAPGEQSRLDWLQRVFGKEASKAAAAPTQQSYLQQHLAAKGIPAGKPEAGGGGGSGRVINLVATAGAPAGEAGSAVQEVDMRANKVVVSVPEVPERSGGSMARLAIHIGSLSGRGSAPR